MGLFIVNIHGDIEGDYEVIKQIPSADVRENIHGEWKRISPAGIYECSNCGQYVLTSDIDFYKFCHGCGAKMKGGE